jgi:hypothetical protein
MWRRKFLLSGNGGVTGEGGGPGRKPKERQRRRRLLMAVLALVVAGAGGGGIGPALAEENGGVLAARELQRLFPGRFMALVRGYRVTFEARRNGRLVGYYGALKDNGRWHVRGRRLCITLEDWLDGKMRCSTVRRGRGAWLVARGIRFRRL